MAARRRIVILGAAGRDFHDFNLVYRDDPACEVVAFTAAQIAGIAGRRYPPTLAGPLYPDGIAIVEEADLDGLIRAARIDQVVLAYSDLPHAQVMHLASHVLAAGADFVLLGPARTQLVSRLPVIAVSAVRTGCGKSQTSRYLAGLLERRGLRAGILRHPMPYGELADQAVQRFRSPDDLGAARCTIEEREEYEPHLALGHTVYAGVDYARILALAEAENDLILWEGGNNDFPFIRPDWHICLVDPLRPGHELAYHPGEATLRMADTVLVVKTDSAAAADVERVCADARRLNPAADIVPAASPVSLERPERLRGRRVVVVEDGPTVSHGGMAWGAAHLAAERAGAVIVDPRPWAAAEIAAVYARYPHLTDVLPAMGYSAAQLDDLRATLAAVPADFVVSASPVDLARLIRLDKPILRARYEYAEVAQPGLAGRLDAFLARRFGPPGRA
ncbi:GTPase [Parasulfuritortus cantonensis]|uniref:GTPase n=1 Tax=Parasulfuritortus cantonensis TaxID=2528202 RepID=A0A4R1BR00_9PROT|nr:cyclic 2,3-diphosphoglycerate synthase [Parasulfuritortus cantonensis]TCJ20189.1 GTPase [Parasulfuritortus cantonensis]